MSTKNLNDLFLLLSTHEKFVQTKKSLTENELHLLMTSTKVHVPTSEHVAQIVGKHGKKIINLSLETNTVIITPTRGNEPFFNISGHYEDVAIAKQAIDLASKHFTKLMDSRSNKCSQGEVTSLFNVPKKYVGIVVGTGGSTILKIKEQTFTRINKVDKENFTSFIVTGSQANVDAAKQAIEDKIQKTFQINFSFTKITL